MRQIATASSPDMATNERSRRTVSSSITMDPQVSASIGRLPQWSANAALETTLAASSMSAVHGTTVTPSGKGCAIGQVLGQAALHLHERSCCVEPGGFDEFPTPGAVLLGGDPDHLLLVRGCRHLPMSHCQCPLEDRLLQVEAIGVSIEPQDRPGAPSRCPSHTSHPLQRSRRPRRGPGACRCRGRTGRATTSRTRAHLRTRGARPHGRRRRVARWRGCRPWRRDAR